MGGPLRKKLAVDPSVVSSTQGAFVFEMAGVIAAFSRPLITEAETFFIQDGISVVLFGAGQGMSAGRVGLEKGLVQVGFCFDTRIQICLHMKSTPREIGHGLGF